MKIFIFALVTGLFAIENAHGFAPPKPIYATPEPACVVKSVKKSPTVFNNVARAAGTDVVYANSPDANGVYQLLRIEPNGATRCLTCTQIPGGPRVDRQKVMVTQHPSGNWIFIGVEWENHELWWIPQAWQIGFIQSGIWIDMWVTNPNGDKWWRLTDFNTTHAANGFVGTPFTSDGNVAAWVEAQMQANMAVDKFGAWKLYRANFVVDANGNPSFQNKADISPATARWLEPGDFHPDNRRLLLSTDLGLPEPRNAFGQEQWTIDIYSGELKRLTNSPKVWDEHGLYSPNGKKVIFMSSDPYQLMDPKSYDVASLKTEFMLMNSDGTGLQQLTHFNEWGYPESQYTFNTIAAVGQFLKNGTIEATVMADNFGSTNWVIEFVGPCGRD